MRIRITKEFDFEAAHALDGYNGKCRDIHGHSYHLKVTFIGKPKQDTNVSECGMVVDFGEIKKLVKSIIEKDSLYVNQDFFDKKLVKSKIYDLFDHRLILREDSRFKSIEKENKGVRYVNYQPTCENMLIEIVNILKDNFTDIELHSVFLRETSNSYAEWYADDVK